MFQKIEELAKEKGISISKLEKKCGFGNGTIRGWKNSSPTIDKLKKVADYLGTTVDELIK